MSRLTVRPYRLGDEGHILPLFKKTFGKPLGCRYWKWRFLENPAGKRQILTAWFGSTLVGHYAFSPIQLSVRGVPAPAALAVCIMTDPAYQNRGVSSALVTSMRQCMLKQGVVMVLGFPNARSHRVFLRDLGWADLHEIPMFSKRISSPSSMPPTPKSIRLLTRPDQRFDSLWKRMAPSLGVAVQRDRSYLDWRFGPGSPHAYRFLVHDKGPEIRGYAVVKPFNGGLDVVDILGENEEVSFGLMCAAAQKACRNGFQSVNMWLNSSSPLHWLLEKEGFQNDLPVTYCSGEWISGAAGGNQMNYANWHITMGDSDVF